MSTLRRETPDRMSLRTAAWDVRRAPLLLAALVLQPRRLMILGTVGAFTGLLVGATRPRLTEGCHVCGGSKEEIAAVQLERLVTEAYLRWSMANAGQRCPTHLEDVARYTQHEDVHDPWGRRLEMHCDVPGQHFAIVSAGPDGKFGTADDFRSWDPEPSAHAAGVVLRFEMVCSPPVEEFAVVSAGEDMQFRTADDILSWELEPDAR
jgi:hypothetical protein